MFLTVRDVLAIHEDQVRRYGGLPGVLNEGLLASAVEAAQQVSGYSDPDLYDLAAAYLYHIARDHPFVEGNKRTAAAAAKAFLYLNEVACRPDPTEFERMVRDVVAGEVSRGDVAALLRRSPTGR